MALNNKTAFSKRAEQLKRYEDSETNRESVMPKNPNERKVRFSAGCIFLAACAAGDKDEVLNMLNCGGADIDTANVDGLTALHQACIEDNLDMVEFLVTHGADVNRKDNEGWTPLHATSSCGIVSIARYLIENGADLAAVNSDGELPIDIAGTNAMADLLQTYIDEQGIDCDDARQQEEKIMLADAKKWLRSDASEADRPHSKTGATALHVAAAKGYTNVLSLLLTCKADVDKQDNDGWTPLMAACYWGKKEAAQLLIASMADMELQNYSNQTCIDMAPKDMAPWLEDLRKNVKRPVPKRRPISQRISDSLDNNNETTKVIRLDIKPPASEQAKANDEQTNKTTQPRDQMQLPLTKENDSNEEIGRKNAQQEKVPDKENQTNDSEVILRRTQSFENDEKFYQKYIELRARIKANSCPALPATPITNSNNNTSSEKESAEKQSSNYIIQRSASLKDHRNQLSKKSNEKTPPTSPTPSTPSTPASTPLGHLRRSFVPPTRDEESETQRKAHAKRVRETRRSTQGVTLDEIKSAEQLVKMKNANNNSNGNFKLEDTSSLSPTTASSTTTTTAAAPVSPSNGVTQDPLKTTNVSSVHRRQNSSENVPNSDSKEAPVTPNRSDDDKENDKENDSRSGLAAQGVIQRRRRPKRRSTGVVHVDMEDIDPENRHESPVENEENKELSGNESRSRAESLASNSLADTNDDGEFVDYKALYEAAKADNDRLRTTLKSRDQDLAAAKAALERLTAAATKSSLSENEKREKRAMERKISEMEEELKQLDALKTENQRLKDENGALIRVISKLSK